MFDMTSLYSGEPVSRSLALTVNMFAMVGLQNTSLVCVREMVPTAHDELKPPGEFGTTKRHVKAMAIYC